MTNLVAEISGHLRAGTCETYSTDLRVRSSAFSYRYPDVAVACDPEFEDGSLDVLLILGVIIEILSPSTEQKDRSEEFAEYRRMPSLTDYVMISQQAPLVEHYSRFQQDIWTFQEKSGFEEKLELPSVGCAIVLQDIYERVTFSAPAPPEE